MIFMVLILAGLLAAVIVSAYMLSKCDGLGEFTGFVGCCLGVVGLLMYSVLVYEYVASGYKADIINREYSTTYTKLEIFYASDVIDTVRELNRTRVELNGDLITPAN